MYLYGVPTVSRPFVYKRLATPGWDWKWSCLYKKMYTLNKYNFFKTFFHNHQLNWNEPRCCLTLNLVRVNFHPKHSDVCPSQNLTPQLSYIWCWHYIWHDLVSLLAPEQANKWVCRSVCVSVHHKILHLNFLSFFWKIMMKIKVG